MWQKLVSRNADLRKLVDKGYAVGFDSNYLVIRDVPYLDNLGQLHWGAIVTKLVFIDQERVTQEDHQVFFAGGIPHESDGRPIPNLGGGATTLMLSERCTDVVVQRSFSNKPRVDQRFADFFEKIESYVGIISGPAMAKHGCTPFTFRVPNDPETQSVFKFADTLTSRAEIGELSARFKDDVVAIIGLGGTGAYVFDFLAKTPVKEIRAFDLDTFQVHNAFRAPGKLEPTELGKSKADVYRFRYENFRHGLSAEPRLVDASCGDDFNNVTFAFVCVDKGNSRSRIFDLLLSKKIPFIDVGMGLNRKQGSLNGLVRTTYFPQDSGASVRKQGLAPLADGPNDEYRLNIQIGELNALNACLAVIKFKQLRGFYTQETTDHHFLFGVGDLRVTSLNVQVEDAKL